MFGWFKPKHLDFVINETSLIKVQGVYFTIRKISPIDYMNGSKVLLKEFDTYKTVKSGEEHALDETKLKKLKEHYTDIFMSSVVSPTLTRKENDPVGTYVGSMFKNWELCQELYEKIMYYTYGKKKVKSIILQSKTS